MMTIKTFRLISWIILVRVIRFIISLQRKDIRVLCRNSIKLSSLLNVIKRLAVKSKKCLFVIKINKSIVGEEMSNDLGNFRFEGYFA